MLSADRSTVRSTVRSALPSPSISLPSAVSKAARVGG